MWDESLMPEGISFDDHIPVFTVPHQQVTFYADDPSSYKQVLTIKNPYDFLVKFKILISSAESDKYTVSVPQGHIKPGHSVEVILQHKAITSSNIGVSDKMRIQLIGIGPVKVSGRRDLCIALLAHKDRHQDKEVFHHVQPEPAVLGHLRQQPYLQSSSRNLIICVVGIVVGVILLAMPKEGDESVYFPDVIPRPTYEFRLVIAYILGAITVLIFQT